MFTADVSLDQIRSAGRIAASIRTQAVFLASPNVSVIDANEADFVVGVIRTSRAMAVGEKLRAETFRRVLLPHLEAETLTQEDANAELERHIRGVKYTGDQFEGVAAKLVTARTTLTVRAGVAGPALANLNQIMEDLRRLAGICDIIRNHCRFTATRMAAAQLVPSIDRLRPHGAIIGELSAWLEQALSIYSSELAAI